MINFKFAWAQFKNVWIILLALMIVLAVFSIIGLVAPGFGDIQELSFERYEGGGSSTSGPSISTGAGTLLNWTIFGVPSLAAFFGFGIAMSVTLINKEVNRGYVASWLTTPMSRATIFNSKLFVIITTTIVANLWSIIFQLIIFGIRMEDFSADVGHLLIADFAILCLSLLTVGIPWIVFSIFTKTGVAMGVSVGILAWFLLCSILLMISNIDSSLKDLKYFKYFTIFSFFNSPFHFAPLPERNPPEGVDKWYVKDIAEIHPLKTLDYAWQLPVMLGGAIGFFTGAQFIAKRKDFAF